MFFKAARSQILAIISSLSSVLLAATFFGLLLAGIKVQDYRLSALAVFPLLVLSLTLITMVRGYQLSGDRLLIQHSGWQTTLPLAELEQAEAIPSAMDASVRLFGNGGLFSFSGLFWSRRLGRYWVYATSRRSTVVLWFRHKTVVVSPEDPQGFTAAILRLRYPPRTDEG